MSLRRPFGARTACFRRSLLALFALLPASAGAAPAPCGLAPDERAWLAGAVGAWQRVSAESLALPAQPLPWIVLFDATCSWDLPPAGSQNSLAAPADEVNADLVVGGEVLTLHGRPHGGAVRLPTGETIPPQLTTFTGTFGTGATRPFFVFALPSVWRQTPRHQYEEGLDRLMRCVFAHELTHTRQSGSYGDRVGAVALAHHLAEFDDDVIQDTFGADAAFAAAYERERDLLYAAVDAADPRVRRQLAREALTALRTRRATAFGGAKAFYGELEDLFLSMEGAANWAGYRVAVTEGATDQEAVAVMRRGGRHWSQDEGLALFLVIDALLPGWQAREFGAAPVSVADLLAAAVATPERPGGANGGAVP